MSEGASTYDAEQLLLRALDTGSEALGEVDDHPAGVDALIAASNCAPLQDRLLAAPRPDLSGGDHPGALVLHVAARAFSDHPDRGHFDADLLEALDASLRIDAPAWVAAAAGIWQLAVHTRGEVSLAWERAKTLRAEHEDSRFGARCLSAFATVAQNAGDDDAAGELWRAARTHSDVVRSARTRWIVEFDWAHVHLLLARGQFGRAGTVLSQVCSGLVAMRDPAAELYYFNAAMQLMFTRILAGRPMDALEETRAARERAAVSFPEFAIWLDGGAALAHTLLGQPKQALQHVRVEQASADTCTLQLGGTLPARMLAAAQLGDGDAFETAMDEARRWERSRDIDPELQLLWRTYGLWAAQLLDADLAQGQLSHELTALVTSAGASMPGLAAHAELALASTRGERASAITHVAALESRGVTCNRDSVDPWGLLPADRTASSAARAVTASDLRIEVLDRTDVVVGGVPVDPAEWEGRRKARIALAVLVAAGGTVHRDELADSLWEGELLDPTTRRSRLSTVLAAVRKTIMAQPRATGDGHARTLVLGSEYVELRLAPGDSTDLADLQDLVHRVAATGCDDLATIEALAQALLPYLSSRPLRDAGMSALVVALRDSLEQVLGAACSGMVEAWLARADAASDSVPVPAAVPAAVLEASERAIELRPYDEAAVSNRMDVLVRAGRRPEASLAFHAVRSRISGDLGATPSVELVRHHARLLQDESVQHELPVR